MSQRECAGFNWPPLSIPAEEPVSISPEAIRRAGPLFGWAWSINDWPTFAPRAFCCSGVSGEPRVASQQFGVPQPARFACRGSWSNRSVPSALGRMSAPLSFQSRVVVVVQPPIAATAGRSGAPVLGRFAVAKSGPALFAIGVGQPDR
jgi:hypothetical protein